MNRHAILGIFCAAAITSTAEAAPVTYHYLASPALIGLAPLDGYWGNGDDVAVPGENRFGATNAYFATIGSGGYFIYGFMQGTYTLSAAVSSGGALSYLAGSATGEQSNYFAPGVPQFINGGPITSDILAGEPNGMTVNAAAQTFATSFSVINQEGDISSYGGSGAFLRHGQDAAVVFAGNPDLIATFNALVPLLPANWTEAAFDFGDFTVVAGPVAPFGTHGSLTQFAYATPLPPSLGLLAAALVFVRRRGRRERG